MAKQRHLTNAPITEALIDIHVTPKDGLTFDVLRDAINASEFGYYEKSPIAQNVVGFRMTSGGSQTETKTHSEQIGLRMHSLDEKYVAQFRITGFTLSRLPPYEDWDGLVGEAKRLWAIYLEHLSPVRVVRIATRYINNLQLPMLPGDTYQTYVNKLVDVPDGAPQAVASFFQRFELIDLDNTSRVNLTIALEATPPSPRIPVILDVDAFRPADLAPSEEQLWETLEDLRNLKNETFFGSITGKATELYE